MIIKPAIKVAMVSPSTPNSDTIPYTITINAPVGPPICTLLPPNTEIIIPAMIAVIIPFSGETPDAMAKAIDNGSATIPTINPAKKSFESVFF